MKKISIILFLIIILLTYPSNSFSTDTDKTDIISSQKESVDIGKFINEAEKYTKEVFKDTDIEGLLNTAISGNIDNQSLVKNILGLFGKETMVSIRTIASIMIVIIIHRDRKSVV